MLASHPCQDNLVSHDESVKMFFRPGPHTLTPVSAPALETALVARLKAIPDGKIAAAARAAGMDTTSLLRLRRGVSTNVRLETLGRLAAALGEPIGALLGEPQPLRPTPAQPTKGEDWHVLPKVALAAAGEPIADLPDSTTWYSFHRTWVERRAKGAGDDDQRLVVVELDKKQESMLPSIRPGAILVVDRGPRGEGVVTKPEEIKRGGVYLVRPEGEGLTVKRLYVEGGVLSLVSDNAERFPPRPIILKGAGRLQQLVVGKVIWVGQEVP